MNQLENKEDSLKSPKDMFYTADGELYVADTDNNRIIHFDKEMNVVKCIYRPEDSTVSQDLTFQPINLVVDQANRIFTNVKNVNSGFMEFDSEGSFIGYVGASEVTVNPLQYLWKMVASEAQISQMINFVPTEYSNISLDSEGFLYATINNFSESSVNSLKAVRRLNAKGADILVRNGDHEPVGDIKYNTEGGQIKGASKFIDVVALENDTYITLDNTRGRLFAYDFQGNLLYAFGGRGYKQGFFMNAVSIEALDDSILVLDTQLGTITQFTLTEYGRYIDKALSYYKIGDYDTSSDQWREVLKLNGNYDLAYLGIGRALLRQKKYKEAMDYFETKSYRSYYSKAFKLYRKDCIEDNIIYVVIILGVLVVIGMSKGRIKKIREEVKENETNS